MVKLKNSQMRSLRDYLEPSPGYVLDLSNPMFAEFFEDVVNINIYDDRYADIGSSKGKRLTSFIKQEPPHIVLLVLVALEQLRNSHRTQLIQAWKTNGELEQWESQSDIWAIEDAPYLEIIEYIKSLSKNVAEDSLFLVINESSLDTVEHEFERSRQYLEKDPEAALTAARSLLEALFKSILITRGVPLPGSPERLTDLYKPVRDILGLAPTDIPATTVNYEDIRKALSGLVSTIDGIGSLRSQKGSAHGRVRGTPRIDCRIGRLGVNAAHTVAIFVIETWAIRFSDDKLTNSRLTHSSIDL